MKKDLGIFSLLKQEEHRQKFAINLIASENYVSKQVMDVVGSVFANKYVEGYPYHRYYSGCAIYDKIELVAIERFKKLFQAEHVNVQPHSGCQANMAVYAALLAPGDTILSMDLASGGHLSHGHKVSFVHQLYHIVSYGVDPVTKTLDYKSIEQLAIKYKPKLIIAGASSYYRSIDFEKFAAIAQKVGALFLADIAHIAGLVAAGLHQSPVPYADVVTMTTHKTFRGPKGAVILCKEKFAKQIDKMVMPGMQGGALMHQVAGKAVAAYEALQQEFKLYQQQVIKNAKMLAQELIMLGYKVVTDGTDTHMFLVDLTLTGLHGKKVEEILESIGIFVNRNTIPFDMLSPLNPSGIRLGVPAITTAGANKEDMKLIANFIDRAIKNYQDITMLAALKLEVQQFMKDL
ncbi:MAG: serine hydroxymethyltransferase [Candidatus Chromulinivorax sp.]